MTKNIKEDGLTILCVEDETHLRNVYRQLLSNEFNCKVILASGANEAIAILEKNPKINLMIIRL